MTAWGIAAEGQEPVPTFYLPTRLGQSPSRGASPLGSLCTEHDTGNSDQSRMDTKAIYISVSLQPQCQLKNLIYSLKFGISCEHLSSTWDTELQLFRISLSASILLCTTVAYVIVEFGSRRWSLRVLCANFNSDNTICIPQKLL